MRANPREFTSQVELPCTVLCDGADTGQIFAGTAVRIDPARMVLRVPGQTRLLPRLGDQVQLDVHLPVSSERAGAKDLSVRARIVEVTESPDGVRTYVLSFRRVQFKDRLEPRDAPRRKAANGTWEM